LLRTVIDFKKKEKLLGELKNIREHSEKGMLRYGYQMAGTAKGRFTSSKPAIQNFSAKE
jgi:DNA polymerase I-like protein with 3'-5' exonuclease and polymerase domains